MKTTIAQWSSIYSIDPKQARRLIKLAEKRYKFAVNVCNGESHPSMPGVTDKNALAHRWEADCNEVEAELEAVAKEVGWLVEYPALYPHFISEGRTIYLPG